MSSSTVVESYGSSTVSAGIVSVRSTKAGRPNGSNGFIACTMTELGRLGIVSWIARLYNS